MLESKFQRAAVYADVNKTFKNGTFIAETDWLVIDFIDERLKLLKCVNKSGKTSYLTKSMEYQNSKISDKIAVNEISFTEKNMLCMESVEKFVNIIRPLLERGRVILHEAYFTIHYLQDGEQKEYTNKEFSNNMNITLKMLYNRFKELAGEKLHVINFSGEKAHVGDPNHRWGLSPVHYMQEYYRLVFDEIMRIING